MSLAPATTAVLLIEYQKEFTSEGFVVHGTAATSSGAHHNAINFDFPMFSTPMTSDDVIAHFPN